MRQPGSDFQMDFCDLIVSMEQAEISPRPVVGAIVVVSGLAVSFLLYLHHASADFAGRWMFFCVGLYFINVHACSVPAVLSKCHAAARGASVRRRKLGPRSTREWSM